MAKKIYEKYIKQGIENWLKELKENKPLSNLSDWMFLIACVFGIILFILALKFLYG